MAKKKEKDDSTSQSGEIPKLIGTSRMSSALHGCLGSTVFQSTVKQAWKRCEGPEHQSKQGFTSLRSEMTRDGWEWMQETQQTFAEKVWDQGATVFSLRSSLRAHIHQEAHNELICADICIL